MVPSFALYGLALGIVGAEVVAAHWRAWRTSDAPPLEASAHLIVVAAQVTALANLLLCDDHLLAHVTSLRHRMGK